MEALSKERLVMKINIERQLKVIDELAQIGKTDTGGVTRVAFSKEDVNARNYIIDKFKELGMIVKIDAAGNIIAASQDIGAKKALTFGSHLDTVVNGGNYDGILGVVSALECYQTIVDGNINLKHPIQIIVFAAEEGIKLNGTFGSRAIAGLLTAEELNMLKQDEAIEGVNFDNIASCQETLKTIKSFIELHIEQGKILETNGNDIGIVTDIFGLKRQTIEVFGQADHAGNTPMNLRNDAMVHAARIIGKVTKYTESLKDTVATFGYVEVAPNCVNVIPGYVKLQLEVRSNDEENFERIDRALNEILSEIETEVRVHQTVFKKPKLLDGQLQSVIEKSIIKCGYNYQRISSGAGHDSASLTCLLPTAMIFVPSFAGISHSDKEYTHPEDIEKGSNTLLETILLLDQANDE
jgi:hydantoinase/carbamoylase family amidase